MAVQVTVLSVDDEQLSAPKKSVFSKVDISIGRSRLNDLVLDHPGVSNTHARVRIEGANGTTKFYVSDLDSTNGTMVGNKRLDPRAETVLSERDRIMIAGFILKLDSVPEDLIVSTDSGSHNIARSPESVAADGTITNTYVVPQDPVTELPTDVTEKKKEQISNETIWNSKLLGAYREEKAGSKTPIDAEPALIDSEVPRKPSGVYPISWPIESEDETNKVSETPAKYEAETKLVLEDHLTVDFIASKLLSISGKILRKDQPVSNVKISDPVLGSVETDELGQFSFKDIIEGTNYNFSFEKTGFVFAPEDLSGNLMEDDISVEVVAKRLLSITGSITHHGAGLADVVVDAGKLGVATTDNMGLYKFDNALEGEEYVLKASKPGYSFGTVKKFA